MDTTELTSALRAAADDVAPRPGFTDEVLAGGRRRQRHRRVLGATTAVAGLAVVVAGALTAGLLTEPGPNDIADNGLEVAANPLLTTATGGDLAGDQAYLDKAIAAWRTGVGTSPNKEALSGLTGDPHVYWAGTTPAGRVALVAQAGPVPDLARVRWADAPPAGWNVQPAALGLVTGDEPTLINDSPPLRPDNGVAFLFGADDREVIAATGDRPAFMSSGYDIPADGRGSRTWQALTDVDGATIGTIDYTGGLGPADVRVARTDDPATLTYRDQLLVLPTSTRVAGFDRQNKPEIKLGLDWPRAEPIVVGGGTGGDNESGLHTDFGEVLGSAGMTDPFARMSVSGTRVLAHLENGYLVTAVEYAPDSRGSRLYVILTKSGQQDQISYHGRIDPDATLPMTAQLPGDLGWLVAQQGAALRYRVGIGDWQPAGQNAAVLPAAATEVEVTKVPGFGTRTVTLTP
jgi:hypothetical protein